MNTITGQRKVRRPSQGVIYVIHYAPDELGECSDVWHYVTAKKETAMAFAKDNARGREIVYVPWPRTKLWPDPMEVGSADFETEIYVHQTNEYFDGA